MGDVVEVGPTLGNVRRIGIRSSTIHTSDGADVIVPNGDLISQRLVNWTYTDQRRRIDLPVSITAAADPPALTDLLVRVAAAHPAVLAAPALDGPADGICREQARLLAALLDRALRSLIASAQRGRGIGARGFAKGRISRSNSGTHRRRRNGSAQLIRVTVPAGSGSKSRPITG